MGTLQSTSTAAWSRGWTARHAKALDDLLRSLDEQGVSYFILRNYEGLPERNPSKDVDVIVDPRAYPVAEHALLDAFERNGFARAFTTRYERAHCWYGFDVDAALTIHIDLIAGYSNKGFEYLTYAELSSHAAPYKGYRVLSDAYDILMLILYKAVGVGELKQRYRAEMSEKYPRVKEEVDPALREIFGDRWGAWLSGKIAQGDYDSIVRVHKALSRASKSRALLRHPAGTVCGIARFLAEKADRMVLRPGRYRRIIAVEAPDGTGKTTFIDALSAMIPRAFLVDASAVKVRHFRPNLLPNLGAVGEKAGVRKQDTDFTNPHRNAPAGRASSLARMVYYWLDYCAGGFLVARRDAQFGSFGIFDRYIYDFLVDPFRSRIDLPYVVRKFFARATYQPQVTFVLKASPETVFARKQELGMDEIARQNAEFAKLGGIARGYTPIDAEQPPEAMADAATRALVLAYTTEVGDLRG